MKQYDPKHRSIYGFRGLANWLRGALLLWLAVVLGAIPALAEQRSHARRGFNRPGNILIADQFNNRVIEADSAGNILWSYGLGPNDF